MYPIFLGSIIGLAIFLERGWSLRKSRVVPTSFYRKLSDLLQKERWVEARQACANDSSHLSKVMAVALDHFETTHKEHLKEKVQEAGMEESFRMERGIDFMGTIASLEPLLGLLGTVIGMIAAFQSIVKGGVGDPRLVAEGVWKALITTAAGLIVAIPMYLAYRYQLRRVDKRILELQKDVSQLVDLLPSVSKESKESILFSSPRLVAVPEEE